MFGGITGLLGVQLTNDHNWNMYQEQKKHNKEMAQIEQGYAQENMQMQADLAERNSLLAWERSEQSAINANQRNLDLYNQTQSTQAKMRELEMAGLNKNLLQGTPSQGGASAGGTGSSSPGQVGLASAQVTPAQIAKSADYASAMANFDMISSITDIAYKQALIKNVNEDTEGKEIDNNVNEQLLFEERKANLDIATQTIAEISAKTTNMRLQNDLLRIEARVKKANEETDIELRKAELSKTLEEIEKIKADKEFTESENARKDELQTLEVSLRSSMIIENISEIKLNKQLTEESKEKIKKLVNDIALNTEKWNFEKGDFKNDKEKQQWAMDIYKEVLTDVTKMQLDSAEKQALIHAIGNGISSIISALGNISGAGIIKGLFNKTPKPQKIGY